MHPEYTPKILVRFWSKVDKSLGALPCWLWLGGITTPGYGQFYIRAGEHASAHRFAYEVAIGPIPDGMQVLHSCDNRRCVNPAHLHLGDHKANMREMAERGRAATGENHGSRSKPDRVPRGERHGLSRLTPETVRTVRMAVYSGVQQKVLAQQHGVSSRTINDIMQGRTWRHVRDAS